MKKSERLDVILQRHGWVSDAQLFQALMEQERLGKPFGSTLVMLGFLSETQLAEALAEQHGTPIWDPSTAVVERAALDLFPRRWVQEKGFLPLAYDPGLQRLEVALADPTNSSLIDEIKRRANVQTVAIAVVPRITLERLWDQFYNKRPEPKRREERVLTHSGPQRSASDLERLGLEFSFAVAQPHEWGSMPQPTARVLLWLTQPFVAKLLKSLLEVECCRVQDWDGTSPALGDWDYLIYDNDNAASHANVLAEIKKKHPRIQCLPRPVFSSVLLGSPLSYDHMRDGYLHLAEFAQRHVGGKTIDRRLGRYAHGIACLLPLTPFEVDTLILACSLSPLVAPDGERERNWNDIAVDLRAPYPVIELFRAAAVSFDDSGIKSGESTPEWPLTARVFQLVTAFLGRAGESRLKTIDALSNLTDWMRQESGRQFDPLVVEAMIRVLREEVLEGCLPPGPAEVFLVSDHAIEWDHLRMQLENEGCRVVTADGAAEARNLAERRTPDAVVWAAAGGIEWVTWQKETYPDVTNFLLLEEPNQALARAALEAGFEDVWTGHWDAGVVIAKLQRALMRGLAKPGEHQGTTGSLEQLSIIDLVQILTAGARSVAINITNGDKDATVVLWQGQIKFAQAVGIEGEAAVYEALTWETGTFTLQPVDEMPAINCRMPNDAILLEGCRLMDERRSVNSK